MGYFSNLKTSQKISLSFSFFSFFLLVTLLICINVIYFFIWYNDQKQESFYDMEQNYSLYYSPSDIHSAQSFKEFLLQKDTLIIPEEGEIVCSPGVQQKIHEEIDQIKDMYFYKVDDTIFFIYSRYFEGVGEVKVFFDTTPYIKSQIIIIRISFFIILIGLFLNFFIGNIISKRLLSDLKSIAKKVKNLDIDTPSEKIVCTSPVDDEIHILSTALNRSFSKIDNQTQNLKQFITDVSHEFKTPLMVINSKLDVYEKKIEKDVCVNPEQMKDFAATIRTQTKKLNTLLETLFFLSRFEEGGKNLETKKVNFSQYLRETSQRILSGFSDETIEVQYEIEENVYKEIETGTFDIVLQNFLTNAYKFSKETKKITIGCTDESFWVQDAGIGMTQPELERIGDKFYKSDRNKEGFGIGIFLVKRILKIYNWRIKFESSKGKGTKVEVFYS